MGRLRIRSDDEYAYVSADDSFGIPEDAFNLLRRRFSAEWSKSLRELRIWRRSASNAIALLELDGHTVRVVKVREKAVERVPGPVECKQCGRPYVAGAVEGRPCVECGGELELVAPQVRRGAGLGGDH